MNIGNSGGGVEEVVVGGGEWFPIGVVVDFLERIGYFVGATGVVGSDESL